MSGSEILDDARLAYNAVLDDIKSKALSTESDIAKYLCHINEAGVFTSTELCIIGEVLFMERLVLRCFVSANCENGFLACVALECLLAKALERSEGDVDAHIEKCVINFENGYSAAHYIVRVVFNRLLPSRQSFIHLDVGASMFERSGMMPASIVHGGIPEDALWLDEINETAKSAKKRCEILFSLWNSLRDRRKFLTMIAKGSCISERLALHLSVGRSVPEFDPAQVYMRD